MIKQIAWNTFKNTGNIDTFLEFKNIEDISEEILLKKSSKIAEAENNEKTPVIEENIEANKNENCKNKWSDNSRENHSRF